MKRKIKIIGILYTRFWEDLIAETKEMPRNTVRDRLWMYVFFFMMLSLIHVFLAAPVLLVFSVVLWILSWVSLHALKILSVLVVFWIVVDEIKDYVKKERNPQKGILGKSWEDIADFVVCPVLKIWYHGKIEKELLCYMGEFSLGDGWYFSIPETIHDEQDRKMLQRKIEKKYAEYLRLDLREVIQSGRVVVTSDTIRIG